MSPKYIEDIATKSLSDMVTLDRRGLDDYRVNVPFSFADGDALKIILRRTSDSKWLLTDEAHTFMYLSYNKIEVGDNISKQKILDRILLSHNMQEHDGRLVMENITPENIGAAIFTFSQALLKVSDFSMWKQERAKSEFFGYFQQLLPECLGNRDYIFNYKYDDIDKDGNYIVDCLVRGSKNNVHVYAVNSESKAKNTVISMFFYGTNLRIPSCAILDSNSNISNRAKTQLADASEKIIDSLDKASKILPIFLDKVA